MTPQLLSSIASRPFNSHFTIGPTPGRYIGTALPILGLVTLTVDTNEIVAEVVNRDAWQARSIQALPPGTMLQLGELFRPIVPGRLVSGSDHGQVLPAEGGWKTVDALYVGASHHYDTGPDGDTYRFSVRTLIVEGPAVGEQIAAVRSVYARGDWSSAGMFQGPPLLIRPLVDKPEEFDAELLAVTTDWQPNDEDWEAVWNMLSFITGNTVKHLADEYYDATGELIRTEYTLGAAARDGRQQHFHTFYGPLAPNGVNQLAEGILRLLKARFPIEVVLHHLHEAAHQAVDIEAQHLVLAIHTAIEGWNGLWGFEHWIDESIWKNYQHTLRKACIPDEIYEDLGEDVSGNLRSAFAHANRTTTAWRERRFFEALEIDVSGVADQRALRLRDELLHNGYFLKRWDALTHDEKQQRIDDVARLRRLVLMIVFRLTSYTGTFMNPLTLQPEEIERCGLPALIAPPHSE